MNGNAARPAPVTYAPPERLRESEYGTVVWPCDPNAITCPAGHVLYHSRAGYAEDRRRQSGHAWFRCDRCKPASHWFAVFSTTPDPHVKCYLVSFECWQQWTTDPNPMSLSTMEMLHVIRDPAGRGYNPRYSARGTHAEGVE